MTRREPSRTGRELQQLAQHGAATRSATGNTVRRFQREPQQQDQQEQTGKIEKQLEQSMTEAGVRRGGANRKRGRLPRKVLTGETRPPANQSRRSRNMTQAGAE